ncbi:MAG: hypothetical protein ACRDSP_05690 [Pseudonocardiaceae bacterium]
MTARRTGTVVPLIVRDGRHPLVSLTMLACTLSGILGLLLPSNPQSVIDQFVPEPWRSVYYLLLCLAGLTILVGVWLPDLRDRLIWERVGLWFFSGTLLVYPLAIYAMHAGKLGFGGVISCLFGVGGVWRITAITYQLQRWRKAAEAAKS